MVHLGKKTRGYWHLVLHQSVRIRTGRHPFFFAELLDNKSSTHPFNLGDCLICGIYCSCSDGKEQTGSQNINDS
jgi:hypothetical protein